MKSTKSIRMLLDEYKISPERISRGGRMFYPDIFYGTHDERIGIVCIIKNEIKYIEEWIEYHKLIGVSHFYIYDNENTDGVYEILKPYIDSGEVTYQFWQGENLDPCVIQNGVYNHAIKHYKDNHDWIAIIDVDEFIVPVEDKMLYDVLDEILDYYEGCRDLSGINYGHVGGIAVNWINYGSSGHSVATNGLVIDNYRYRAKSNYFKNYTIKMIYNPRAVNEVSVHYAKEYVQGYCSISENGSCIPNCVSTFPDGRGEIIRLNHYYTKSDEEFANKFRRGWERHKCWGEAYIQNRVEIVNKYCNEMYDDIMDRYIERLKIDKN